MDTTDEGHVQQIDNQGEVSAFTRAVQRLKFLIAINLTIKKINLCYSYF